MKFTRSDIAVAAACVAGLLLSMHADAANWLMVQGTEPNAAAERARIWGFIQPEYQNTSGTKLPAGPFAGTPAAFNQMRPDLKSNSGFNIIRARFGVRGIGMPIDSNVNYFLLAELGNNGITNQGGASVKLTDASVTLNHVKGARLRAGMFKVPGSEEGLQAIHVFDYINFTNGANQILLERFFDATNGANNPADAANKPNGPVNAFRDTGLQVFDSFMKDDWEHSYALMLGNGNGITRSDNDDNKELYLYWSSAKVFGGAGPRRQDWKLFAWYQDGKRSLLNGGSVAEFDRERWGVGTTYRKGKYRAAAEYFKADGVIFNGTSGGAVAGTVNAGGAVSNFSVLPTDEADSWYLDLGYKPHPDWELDIRYDVLNRGTVAAATERKFDTLTLGAQYYLNRKSRFLLNYEIRNAEAPNAAASAAPNLILDAMDDRISAQLLIIF